MIFECCVGFVVRNFPALRPSNQSNPYVGLFVTNFSALRPSTHTICPSGDYAPHVLSSRKSCEIYSRILEQRIIRLGTHAKVGLDNVQ